jgi:hypothetical protein
LASPAARWAVVASILLACALLAWETVTRAFAHYHDQTDPRLALQLDAHDPQALTTLADRLLIVQRGPSDLDAAEAAARRVLLSAPLQVAALRDLGLVADARKQKARAAAIMERAGLRGFRDVRTQTWLLQRAFAGHESKAALLRMDVLLRTNPEFGERLYPYLAAVLTDDEAVDFLSRRLAADPAWRTPALIYLSAHAHDPGAVARLYQALVTLGRPPNDQEAVALLQRMTMDGRNGAAYLLWISYLPSSALGNLGDLYDGNFQGLPGSPPFNWRFAATPGVTVEVSKAGPSGKSALHIDFPADNTVSLAEQLLILPPGSYRLSGRFMVSRPAAGAHLQWTISCAGSPTQQLSVIRQDGGVTSTWTPFSSTFTTPDHCDAQWLRLEGLPGDGFGELSAWYGALAVRPTSAAPTPPPPA